MSKYRYITLKQHCAKCSRIVTRKFDTINQAILGLRDGSITCLFCKQRVAAQPDLFHSMVANHAEQQENTEKPVEQTAIAEGASGDASLSPRSDDTPI